jgi:UDP-N-acetylglucosamine 2-epimerase (non-hydrolysing)/UDP-GlcNAc3NAcA epimerase
MKKLRLLTVVGARPQFIKAATVSRALAAFNRSHAPVAIEELIVHTGQHYDRNMSNIFFDELEIPPPLVSLEVGSGTHGAQTGAMLERIEGVLIEERPDRVLVYGDTNSTLAATLAAVKLHIPVAHVEAGLRAYNRLIPEEINRVVADGLCDILLCPTETAVRNLAAESLTRGVYKVGDVMYDSVLFNTALAAKSNSVVRRLGLKPKSFYLSTIHRAENTDDRQRLESILAALVRIETPIVLPLHPRTRDILGPALAEIGGKVRVVEPVSYLEMLMLERNARIILTDSGGVQKEAYWCGVPCITMRDETEWVELVEAGCNRVVGVETEAILNAVADIESQGATLPANCPRNLYGDGRSADKIVEILASHWPAPGI